MKKIITILFFLLCSNTVFAQNLCDASCNLTITFPDGGSITAVEPITLVFGEGGYINDGVVITGYASGEEVMLDAGKSFVFLDEGRLDLGSGGNIEYTNISITTNGVIEVASSGGNEKVFIFEMTLIGTLEFIFNNDVVVVAEGVLTMSEGEVTLAGSDGVVFSNYGVFDGQGDVSIILVFDWSGATNWGDLVDCNPSLSGEGSSATLISGSSVIPAGANCTGTISIGDTLGGTITLTGDTSIIEDAVVLTEGELTLTEVTVDNNESVVIDNQKSESKDDGSASMDWLTLGLLLVLIRFYRKTGFSIR